MIIFKFEKLKLQLWPSWTAVSWTGCAGFENFRTLAIGVKIL
jgi:hypothetical protein